MLCHIVMVFLRSRGGGLGRARKCGRVSEENVVASIADSLM